MVGGGRSLQHAWVVGGAGLRWWSHHSLDLWPLVHLHGPPFLPAQVWLQNLLACPSYSPWEVHDSGKEGQRDVP